MDHGIELFTMIESVLAGRMPVSTFAERFYGYYFEQVPDGALSASEEAFAESVCERIDLIADAPSSETSRQGRIDHGDLVEWLRVRYSEFAARESE